jgi:hypothetical protein
MVKRGRYDINGGGVGKGRGKAIRENFGVEEL